MQFWPEKPFVYGLARTEKGRIKKKAKIYCHILVVLPPAIQFGINCHWQKAHKLDKPVQYQCSQQVIPELE